MALRDAYLRMIKAFPGGWDGMADALRLSRSALHNRVYECKGQAVTVEQALTMQALSGVPAFAEAMAEDAGGVFLPLPDAVVCGDGMLAEASAEWQAEVGRSAQALVDAIRTHAVRMHMVDAVEESLKRDYARGMEMVAVLRGMAEPETHTAGASLQVGGWSNR